MADDQAYNTENSLPEFEKPPVVEVICGVLFQKIPGLLSAHLGSLWDKVRADYPNCREVPPLAPVVERFGKPGAIKVEFTDVPPMPRTWFIHKNETGIIQVQRDRFLHNWKKVRDSDEYPRYETVIRLFKDHLATFESFLSDHSLGPLLPAQYELTYVNHVPEGEGWTSLAQIGDICPDFRRRDGVNRFLPDPEAINWRTSFAMPEKIGRLHVTIRHAVRVEDQRRLLQLELTARGLPSDVSGTTMWDWFDQAHRWIVYGFADLTAESIRKNVWRQIR